MKWCCLTFKSWFEAAGERGSGILIERGQDAQPQFIIQHRAVDKGLEESVHSEESVTLVSQARIHYCPWCGRGLKKTYGEYVDSLRRPDLRLIIPGLDD
jgi:hypothetical protein